MARLTPTFSTNRAVRQYTDEHYLSASAAFQQRAEKQGSLGADLLKWRAELAKHWPSVRFGSATLEEKDGKHLFQAQIFLGDLDPEFVSVELYAEGQNGDAPERHLMNRGGPLVGSANGFTYNAAIAAVRPPADYTSRLIPQHQGALVPLEASFILWHDSPSWR